MLEMLVSKEKEGHACDVVTVVRLDEIGVEDAVVVS